jgi:4-amino-4-deoxy-L-arabinose transferase-like glycosyltransferase
MIDAAGSSPGSRLRSALTIALLVSAAAALALRVAAIAEPLGIDQSLWASAARGMARGQLLYRDVWEQRPPGIYWVYLAGFQVLGWTPATVAWLDLLAAAVTTLLLYGIARTLSRGITAALAAALYASMTMPAWLYGHGGFLERAVSETFIVVCVSASALSAARWQQRPSGLRASGIGLFAGATLVFKPNAGLYFPALLAWMLVYSWHRLGDPRRTAFSTVVIASAAAAIVPVIALSWLWRLDLLGHATTAVIDFNRYYVGEGFDPGAYALAFSKAVWFRIKTEPLWLAGAVGVVIGVWTTVRERRLPPLAGLAMFWGAAGACVIVVNGARLFNSYFIQVLPPLSLLGAWVLSDALQTSSARRVIRWTCVGLMLFLLVQRNYVGRVVEAAKTDLDVLVGRTDRIPYLEHFGGYDNRRGYSARANAELADYLRAHTEPDERIFLFGINGAGVYFLADRLPAHRFLRVNFFVDTDFPDPSFRLDAVLRELDAAPPRYIVFERLHVSSDPDMARTVDGLPEDPAVARLLSGYLLETRIEDFAVYRRLE